MAEFKDGMLHAYATSGDAFAALDASLMDLDAALDENPLDLGEFVRGTKNFKPPLTEGQATYAFKGLDVDGDGLVEKDEFADGVESGVFYRVTTTSAPAPSTGGAALTEHAPITVADFKASMLRSYSTAPDAFVAFGASETNVGAARRAHPITLKQFVRGTQTFSPPLTRAQANYAFNALDADADGMLVSAEFSEGLARGEFHPTEEDFPELGAVPAATSAAPVPGTGDASTVPAPKAAVAEKELALSGPAPPSTAAPLAGAPALPHPESALAEQLPPSAVISMQDFKARMLGGHGSALKAFQAFGANPVLLKNFVRGTETFEPPLSRDQATYAFEGLDADHDHLVSSFEFFEVLEFGRFFPTLRDLVDFGSAQRAASASSTPDVRVGAHGRSMGAGPSVGFRVLQALVIITIFPLLCMLLPCTKGIWQKLLEMGGGEPYRTVSMHSPSRSCSGQSGSLELAPARQPVAQRRSRLHAMFGFFNCCLRPDDDPEDPPPQLQQPCIPRFDRHG